MTAGPAGTAPMELNGVEEPMSIRRKVLATGLGLAALLALAACGPTGYRAADFEAGAYGYSDKQVDDDEYAIVVTGNRETGPERVADIALLRAAHIARQESRERFRVLIEQSEALTRHGVAAVPVLLGGVLVAVPIAETDASEPHTVLVIRLLRDDEPPSPGDLDAATIIAEIAPRLEAE